ncbi:MAG: ABC transporter ATP-binding protein/permease [Lachnospiraceae bacterium]
MSKLFKFMKPYAGSVFAILCVLIIQAYCELSLPSYTSNIVNIGIQQSGIDENVPKTILKEDLEKLLLFVPSDEQKKVQEAYEEGKYDAYRYTGGVEGTILRLREDVLNKKERLEELSDILTKPMMLVSGFDSESDMTKQIEEQMKQQMSEQMQAQQMQEGQMQAQQEMTDMAEMSIYDIFSMMPEEQRGQTVQKITEKLADMPDSILEQAGAAYVRQAYSNLGINTDKISSAYIRSTGAKMLALAALGMFASIMVGLLASRVGAGIGRGLRRDVFRKVVGFSNAEFDKFSTASLITRSTNDIQQVQLLSVMVLRMVLYSPILAAGGVWKVFHTNVDMSWIIALGVVLILLVVGTLFLVVMPKFKIVQNQVDRLNLVSREILTGLPVIRAFSTEKYEEQRFDTANRELTKTNLFVNRAMTFMMPVMMLIMNGISVLIIWVGGHGVNDGSMQVGDMMAFIQYTMQIIMSFLMICMISVMLPRAAVSAERVDEVLKSETLIHDPEKSPEAAEGPKSRGRGEVVFDHVSFRYPGAEENVLSDISFTAKPGQTTAFIGSTGSGKSTLVNLIPRFYDVTEGHISIDGTDIRDMKQHDLREKLGYVPQKGVLFSGTIASNILYGNPKGSEPLMKEAAEIAQAADFIGEKKKGYESPISQGGSNVSGGQKQRLSIARAIAKSPEVYIFDDSFSALDYKTDVTLRNALKKKTADSTVLIVAQRISTILHAEQIIVLDDGKIAGKGTHKELLKTCDAYYQIAASQLSEKELADDMKEVE